MTNNQGRAVMLGAIVAILIIGAFLLGRGGLDPEGPGERMGQALDNAADEIKNELEQSDR